MHKENGFCKLQAGGRVEVGVQIGGNGFLRQSCIAFNGSELSKPRKTSPQTSAPPCSQQFGRDSSTPNMTGRPGRRTTNKGSSVSHLACTPLRPLATVLCFIVAETETEGEGGDHVHCKGGNFARSYSVYI